jgi:hypothetical protein
MVLNREDRKFLMAKAGDGVIVKIDVCDFDIGRK